MSTKDMKLFIHEILFYNSLVNFTSHKQYVDTLRAIIVNSIKLSKYTRID